MPKVDEKMRKSKSRDEDSTESFAFKSKGCRKSFILRELRKQRTLKRSSYLNEVEKET